MQWSSVSFTEWLCIMADEAIYSKFSRSPPLPPRDLANPFDKVTLRHYFPPSVVYRLSLYALNMKPKNANTSVLLESGTFVIRGEGRKKQRIYVNMVVDSARHECRVFPWIFFFAIASRPALRPTQLSTQWLPWGYLRARHFSGRAETLRRKRDSARTYAPVTEITISIYRKSVFKCRRPTHHLETWATELSQVSAYVYLYLIRQIRSVRRKAIVHYVFNGSFLCHLCAQKLSFSK
jgi:hypothetical protein